MGATTFRLTMFNKRMAEYSDNDSIPRPVRVPPCRAFGFDQIERAW